MNDMVKSMEGRVNIYGWGNCDLEEQQITCYINSEEHYLKLVFAEEDFNCDDRDIFIDALELLVEGQAVCTFYKCHINEISKNECAFIYEISIEGKYIDRVNEISCTAVEFMINAYPIPLVAASFLPDISEIGSSNVIVKCRNCENNVLVTIETSNNMMLLDELETIFFNILDITFLGNGYYPYLNSVCLISRHYLLYVSKCCTIL